MGARYRDAAIFPLLTVAAFTKPGRRCWLLLGSDLLADGCSHRTNGQGEEPAYLCRL